MDFTKVHHKTISAPYLYSMFKKKKKKGGVLQKYIKKKFFKIKDTNS